MLTVLCNGETLLLVPVDSGARRTRSGSGACRDLRAPSYAIFGGLVFTQLCEPYLKAEWGDDFDARAPLPLLERWQYGLREAATDQVVVLSQVLAPASTSVLGETFASLTSSAIARSASRRAAAAT